MKQTLAIEITAGSSEDEPLIAKTAKEIEDYALGYGEMANSITVIVSQRSDEAIKSTKEQAAIIATCNELCTMLLTKNAAYGNSALDPLRIFSKASLDAQINVRLDDKLSRIVRGAAAGEDVEWDLMGYLVLKRVNKKLKEA